MSEESQVPAGSVGEDELPDDFTVKLERVFSGPMDLLLHLVREHEVEIHEIEIHRVVSDYLGYLEHLADLDIEAAGDFVVMAATLMAIKSRSLLPVEELDLEEELDPRDELIQRLVEYRRFRQSAETLESKLLERQAIHARGWHGEVKVHTPERTLDLSDVTVWDLLTAWSRLQSEVLANRPHRVQGDPRPLRWYVENVVQRLRTDGTFSLRRMVEGGSEETATREGLVGSFCAVLELVKLGIAGVDQDQPMGDIAVRLRDDLDAPIEELLAGATFEEIDPAVKAEAEQALGAAGIDVETPSDFEHPSSASD